MLVSVLVPGADVGVGSIGVGVDAAAWGGEISFGVVVRRCVGVVGDVGGVFVVVVMVLVVELVLVFVSCWC